MPIRRKVKRPSFIAVASLVYNDAFARFGRAGLPRPAADPRLVKTERSAPGLMGGMPKERAFAKDAANELKPPLAGRLRQSETQPTGANRIHSS